MGINVKINEADHNRAHSAIILMALHEINHSLNEKDYGEMHFSYDLKNHSATFEIATGITNTILLADIHNYMNDIDPISAALPAKEIYEYLYDGYGNPKVFCRLEGNFVFEKVFDELDGIDGNEVIITAINIEHNKETDKISYGIKITVRNR